MSEIIYILTNEAMPGFVKIGKTSTSLEQRIKELSGSTSIPVPFTCFYACIVENAGFVEKQLHNAFDNHRINPRREFFQIDPERVVAALKLAEKEDITPKIDLTESKEDQDSLNQVRKMRPAFNFTQAQIPVGATLTFSRDTAIQATVNSDRTILFNGVPTSLSAAAQQLLGYKYNVQGTAYWTYEGETLDERRQRIESTSAQTAP